MTNNRKPKRFAPQPKRRRPKRAAKIEVSPDAPQLPPGAVAADPSKQVPNNSYSPPPTYYVDKEFTCKDCGRAEVWTARQQKWYCEVAGGSLFATAVRCRNCRRKARESRKSNGDPKPIKHQGSLMKRVCTAVEPVLLQAGFEFRGKNCPAPGESAYLDYDRPGLMLRLLFRRNDGRLVAETLDDDANYQLVAAQELNPTGVSTPALLEWIDAFCSAVKEYFRELSDSEALEPGSPP